MRQQGAVWMEGDDVKYGSSLPHSAQDYLLWCGGTANSIEIADIVVMSKRRSGIGRKLVSAMLLALDTETVVWACTRTTNEIAQQFYEALGFDVAGVVRRLHGTEQGADGVIYLRRAGGPI